jgi:hypothetical protein
VVVALGEPGVPVISWAGPGKVTNVTTAAASNEKPLQTNFRFIVFYLLVLSGGIGSESARSIEAQPGRDEAAFSRHHLWAFVKSPILSKLTVVI